MVTTNSSRISKHVGLGISLKNCPRSKVFITHLNNLGRSICYDEALRTEANWASEMIKTGDGFAILQSKIEKAKQPFFTQIASNNGDYGQEMHYNTLQTLSLLVWKL